MYILVSKCHFCNSNVDTLHFGKGKEACHAWESVSVGLDVPYTGLVEPVFFCFFVFLRGKWCTYDGSKQSDHCLLDHITNSH